MAAGMLSCLMSADAFAENGVADGNAVREVRLVSPDGRQEMTIAVADENGATRIIWSAGRDGRAVILPSAMDLTVDNHVWEHALARFYEPLDRWFDNLELKDVTYSSRDTVWHNAYGERSSVHDAWNGAVLHFAKDDGSDYRLDIEARAYDEGVAFRYVLPMHPDAIYHRVKADNTEFTFPDGSLAWVTWWAQGSYELMPLKDWPDECERPVTVKIAEDLYAAVGEAAQIDFPRGKFRLSGTKENTLVTALNDDGADIVTPYAMPWRVVMAAGSPGELLENNDIYLNLNEASKIADESWIRPGKIMRETRLTTENALKVIDFCAAHNMQYLLFDWKWYGPAFDFASDATTVIPQLDMPRVIAYGKEKGVGIWLYVNQHALQKQAEELFPVFREWGVAGVKFGFVQFCSQHWADWVHRLVRLAAENNLMVNIHDEYRPTGYSRTWPNLLTQEGIRGNEEFPRGTHNTILPFTRMLCGAGDYTVCYFDSRIKNTHAHQLAFPIIFFSPLQTLYWYDTPDRVRDVPELEFFDNVPVVWDDTKVVDDSMGEHVVIARRSGEEWFAGAISGSNACRIEVPTDFLEPGKDYVLRVYTDDDTVDTPTRVRVARYIVRGGDVLSFDLKADGGAAIHFLPASKQDLKEYGKLKKNAVL